MGKGQLLAFNEHLLGARQGSKCSVRTIEPSQKHVIYYHCPHLRKENIYKELSDTKNNKTRKSLGLDLNQIRLRALKYFPSEDSLLLRP